MTRALIFWTVVLVIGSDLGYISCIMSLMKHLSVRSHNRVD